MAHTGDQGGFQIDVQAREMRHQRLRHETELQIWI